MKVNSQVTWTEARPGVSRHDLLRQVLHDPHGIQAHADHLADEPDDVLLVVAAVRVGVNAAAFASWQWLGGVGNWNSGGRGCRASFVSEWWGGGDGEAGNQ